MRHVGESVTVLPEDEEDSFLPDGGIRNARMREEIEQLRKEVAHWKRIVNEAPTADHSKRVIRLYHYPSCNSTLPFNRFRGEH